MKEQLTDAWNMHNAMNLLLIDNLGDDAMEKSLSTRGGRTVYLQLLHLYDVRLIWLEIISKDLYSKQEKPGKQAAFDRATLRKYFVNSSGAIETLISRSWDDGGKLKGYKKGLVPFITYLISHESHHRGNILLTLKQSGIKIPDKLKWGLWEWGK